MKKSELLALLQADLDARGDSEVVVASYNHDKQREERSDPISTFTAEDGEFGIWVYTF
jgi:hypothetical protein